MGGSQKCVMIRRFKCSSVSTALHRSERFAPFDGLFIGGGCLWRLQKSIKNIMMTNFPENNTA